MTPLFSIVVTVFNVEDYLASCLDSILTQDEGDLEIILIDDASSDRSKEICDAYARRECVHVIHHAKNTGVSIARNHGIERATGDYVLYVDGDDKVMDGGFAALRKAIADYRRADVIVARYTSQNGDSSNDFMFHPEVIAKGTPEALLDHINRGFFHPDPCWHYAIKRRFLLDKKLFFLDVKIGEDQEYAARLLTAATTLGFCPTPFYWYRGREGSLNKSHDIPSTAGLLVIAGAMRKYKREFSACATRTEFLDRCIEHANGRFAGRLTIHTDAEIHEISKVAPGNDFRDLVSLFKEVDMESLTAELGSAAALVRYREALEQVTLSLVTGMEGRKIYLYCMGPTGIAVLHTLQKHHVPVEGFIDDNQSLQGRSVSGVPILTSVAFAGLPPDSLARAQVIVCIPRISAFTYLAEKLVGAGLAPSQIVHRKF